jgi:dGTPase
MTDYWEDRQGGVDADDIRTAYERDYARVVHSASFRRLQAKTQVLGLGDSDFYRTRLTHSMEVSQIGEAIAKKLLRQTGESDPIHVHLPHPTLIRTICLAHDLGHPPFGHGGEIALNKCMRTHGGFEGNGQTLRIMAKLEPYHATYGMNLTRRTLLGVLKYPASYDTVNKPSAYPKDANQAGSAFKADEYKPPKCYLDTEVDTIAWIKSGDLTAEWDMFASIKSTERHSKTKYKALDTSIVELADDIAYGVHDLEDALSLRLFTQRQFASDLPQKQIARYLEALGSTYDAFVGQLFSDDTCERKAAIGDLVGYFVNAIQLSSDHNGLSHPVLSANAVMDEDVAAELKALKDFVYFDVIKATPVQQLEFKGQKIVTELFDTFMIDPKRLLTPREFEKAKELPMERVICDYIAGMTDEYATKRYQQLFEPRIGSVFDRL